MNRFILFRIFIGSLLISLSSCGNNNQDASNNTTSIQKEVLAEQILASEFAGNYHGIQSSYFVKNKYGDDMVINGNKVSISSNDLKFLLKENGNVSLQQTNLEDNSRVYYNGTFKIISEDASSLKIECSLNDGKTSNPTYNLTINKSDKTGICNGHDEPEVKLEKI